MADSFTAGATSGSGGTTPGAIIGDNAVPFAAAALTSAGSPDTLTTGDLTKGDAGEVGLLTNFAVEFWFLNSALLAPAANRTIFQGPTTSSPGTTGQWYFTHTTTGTLQFSVIDSTGATNTAAGATNVLPIMAAGSGRYSDSFVHVVGVAVAGGNLILYINGVSDGTAAWGSKSAQTMGTTAGTLDMRLSGPVNATNYDFDAVAVYKTSLSATRVLEHYNAGANRGFPVQTTSARINAALDVAGHRSPRFINNSTRNVIPRYMSGQAPIEEVRTAVEAEEADGAFFTDASGGVRFLQDGHRSVYPYATAKAIFGDGGGSELQYLDVTVDYSLSFVINEWNVTRSVYGITSPSTQTSSDSTSISRYFRRSQSVADVPVTTDADASTIASRLLAKYKDPVYLITSIKPNMGDQQTAAAVFELELMDRIRILRTPPGGGARIDQDVFIQRIELSGGSNGVPDCTLGVSPV